MKESSTKVRTPMFRSLILGAVLVITIIILVLAWFTSSHIATANGLKVVSASGLGLQTSWEPDRGFQTEIKRDVTNLLKLPLITGDGTTFFQPALNRTTGDPLTDSDGNWLSKDVTVTAAKYDATTKTYSEGQYYEEDIYFSSSEELDVYLTNQSKVTPLDDDNESMERKSDYGEFSKDNIAGAVRVGIFRVDDTYDDDGNVASETETPIYTWVPNENYELKSYNNLIPITSTADSGETESSFDPRDPAKTFGLKDNDDYELSDQYLWEVSVSSGTNDPSSIQSCQMYKNKTTNNLIGAATITSTTSVDHGFLISSQGGTSLPTSNYQTPNGSKAETQCELQASEWDGNIWVGAYFDNHTRDVTNPTNKQNMKLPQLTINLGSDGNLGEFFGTHDRFQILFEYSPNSNFSGTSTKIRIIGFVFYNNASNQGDDPENWAGVVGGAGEGKNIGGGSYTHYSITDGATVVISNKTSTILEKTFGINAVATSTNAVQLTMQEGVTGDNKKYIYPVNPYSSQLFKATITGTDKYTFESLSTGKYLAISGDNVILQNSPYEFELQTGANGPLLYSEAAGKYISFNSRKFLASTSTDSAYLEIYQGSSFSFTKDGNKESTYQYLLAGTSGFQTLTNIKLTSELTYSGASSVPVTTLAKRDDNENSDYYGHIRVRIWVEGTDREAKIPLAGGKFATHLAFFGQPKSSTGA